MNLFMGERQRMPGGKQANNEAVVFLPQATKAFCFRANQTKRTKAYIVNI
jgi:hypothetical protein